MKPEPVIAMVILVALSIWIVYQRPNPLGDIETRPGAELYEIRAAQSKGVIEAVADEEGIYTFRVFMRDGHVSPILGVHELEAVLGPEVAERMTTIGQNPLFRLFNITSWRSFIWIAVGLGGQLIFSARFLVQWITSERARKSVVPTVFWWISLFGALLMAVYFIWRRDVVALVGQAAGVVIYARNIRLIYKEQRAAASG